MSRLKPGDHVVCSFLPACGHCRLYRAGQLKLDELVTNRYRLDYVNQGYRDMLGGRNIRGLMSHDS